MGINGINFNLIFSADLKLIYPGDQNFWIFFQRVRYRHMFLLVLLGPEAIDLHSRVATFLWCGKLSVEPTQRKLL